MLIREKDRLALIEIFSTCSLPIEVWAYGSRVDGSAHSGSDLDLVVRTADLTPMPLDSLVDLIDKIKNSNIPILVELRDWARLPETFKTNILEQYEVLFSNLH